MKNLNTKTLLATSVAALLSFNALAATPVDKTLTVTFDHPQSVAIGDGTATATTATGNNVSTTWEVTSNNAVVISFTGASKATDGKPITTPVLAKQEVDAKDTFITNQWDQLTTTYGVAISDLGKTGSTQNDKVEWGGAGTPTGTPDSLVAGAATAGGLTKTLGAIMPKDNGKFKYTLYTKGTGDTSTTQSGDYTATVTTTVTAQEMDGQ